MQPWVVDVDAGFDRRPAFSEAAIGVLCVVGELSSARSRSLRTAMLRGLLAADGGASGSSSIIGAIS